MKMLIAFLLCGIALAGCRTVTSERIPEWIERSYVFQSHREVRDLVFAPHSPILFSASGNFFAGNIQAWEVFTGDPFHLYHDRMGAVMGIALAFDGDTLISASQDGNIRLWDAQSARLDTVLHTSEWPLRSVAASPDSARIAFGQRDGRVHLWDIRAEELTASWADHSIDVSGLAFSKEGRWLASSDGLTLHLWDSQTNERAALAVESPYGLAFSPIEEAWLAVGSAQGKVYLWDIEKQTQLALFQATSGYLMWDVAFSPDGELLASGNSDGSAVIWAVETGERLAILPGHRQGVTAVAFSPDGRFLATGGADKQVHLWRLDRQRSVSAGFLRNHF